MVLEKYHFKKKLFFSKTDRPKKGLRLSSSFHFAEEGWVATAAMVAAPEHPVRAAAARASLQDAGARARLSASRRCTQPQASSRQRTNANSTAGLSSFGRAPGDTQGQGSHGPWKPRPSLMPSPADLKAETSHGLKAEIIRSQGPRPSNGLTADFASSSPVRDFASSHLGAGHHLRCPFQEKYSDKHKKKKKIQDKTYTRLKFGFTDLI